MSGYKRVNFYELCRLCATNREKKKINIFEEEGKKMQLQAKIQACLSVKVSESDCLPKVVCSDCLKNLEESFSFQKHCVSSEKMLSTYFNNYRHTDDFKRNGQVYIKDVESTKETNNVSINNLKQEESIPNINVSVNQNGEVIKITQNKIDETEKIAVVVNPSGVVSTQNFGLIQTEDNLNYLDVHQSYTIATENITNQEIKEIKRDNNKMTKSFSCERCLKVFKRREHLYQHEKLHSGFRPFVCEHCKKSFMRKEHLHRHMTCHSGQRNFMCQLCLKSFSRNDNLLKHKKTHDKKAGFRCKICGKHFAVKHYYIAHKCGNNT
nr:zinc finger protein 519-like [Onthophagus taurus]